MRLQSERAFEDIDVRRRADERAAVIHAAAIDDIVAVNG